MAFPSVQDRYGQTSPGSNTTSWTVTFPAGWDTNLAGDRIYAFVSIDTGGIAGNGVVSTATPGWTLLDQGAQTQINAAVFYYEVAANNTAIPDLVIDSTSSEQYSACCTWVRSATGELDHILTAEVTGNSTNSDPPALTNTGPTIDALIIASRHGDSTVAASAPPTGYSNQQSQPHVNSNGASTDTAEKQATLANGASEDPGTWTSATEQWVCYTLAIYEVSTAVFPAVLGRAKAASPASDATSWTIDFPAGWDDNLTGDVIAVFFSTDGAPVISTTSSGWSILTQVASSTVVKGAILLFTVSADDTAIPDLVIDVDSAQQFSYVALWLRSSTGTLGVTQTNNTGSSTTPDPPAVTNPVGSSANFLAVASRHTDLSEASTAQPAGYSNIQQQQAGSNLGATTETCEKQITLSTGASENPGTFTIPNSRRWTTFSVLFYETTAVSGGRPKIRIGAAFLSKPLKVRIAGAWQEKPVKIRIGGVWVLAS